jgi:hypothetical protein
MVDDETENKVSAVLVVVAKVIALGVGLASISCFFSSSIVRSKP